MQEYKRRAEGRPNVKMQRKSYILMNAICTGSTDERHTKSNFWQCANPMDRTDIPISQEEEAERYRVLVDTMNDGFGIINEEGIFTYVNNRFADMLGVSPMDMVGHPLLDFVADQSKNTLLENINRRQHGVASQYELDWLKATGGTVPTIVSGAPLIGPNGIHRGSYAVVTDITLLKKTRAEIRESAEKFRRIFDESPIGIELFDENGVLIEANQAALAIGGISSLDELVGFELFSDPNTPEWVKQKLKNNETVKYEVEFDFSKVRESNLYATKRTGIITLDSQITPLGVQKGGRLQGYLLQMSEVTEQKIAEERYRLLAENAADIIWTADMTFNLTFLSPSVKRVLGYEPSELVGKSFLDIMTPESMRAVKTAMATAMKIEESGVKKTHGDAPVLELELKRKDGLTAWTEVTRTFLRDDDNKPIGIMGVARDIEERRAAELAMVASESKYRYLVEQSFQGLIIVTGQPLHVEYCNVAFAGFLGRTPDEVMSFTQEQIQNSIHPEDLQHLLTRFQELMQGDEPFSTPFAMRTFRKDGSMRWLEVFGRLVQYDDKPALQVIAMDVSDRQIAEKKIQTQKERAMLYLDLMSHDFRNQLQIILGSTMVMETMLKDPESRRLLGQIVSAVERCQSMISKVKVTEPLMSVALRPRKLDSAVGSTIDVMKDRYKDTTFHLAIHANLAIIDADQFLEQLITNIIENAIEHNPKQYREVWITLSEDMHGYVLAISDNGHGISGALKSAIFDVSRRYGGVGLHQAKQICDKYGARIEVRDRVPSSVSEGAEFTIWFPKT